MKSKESAVKAMVVICFCVLITISAFILVKGWMGGYFRSVETMREYIASFGIWGSIALGLIQASQVVLPILPGFLGCFVGAALFGPVVGFLVNYIGISVGSIAAYYLARRFGVQLVNKMLNMNKYERYLERIHKSKSYTTILFLSILLPLAPDDFLCYFSGLIDITPKKFIAIIAVAKPWCILFYSIFFAHFI